MKRRFHNVLSATAVRWKLAMICVAVVVTQKVPLPASVQAEKKVLSALSACEKNMESLAPDSPLGSQFLAFIHKLCGKHRLGAKDCLSFQSACSFRIDSVGGEMSVRLRSAHERVLQKLAYVGADSLKGGANKRLNSSMLSSAEEWLEASWWARGKPLPTQFAAEDTAVFFAGREGRRLVAVQKSTLLETGAGVQSAISKRWIDSHEDSSWRAYMTERIISKGVFGSPVRFGVQGSIFVSTTFKLLHDVEQLSYLLNKGKLPQEFWQIVHGYISILAHREHTGAEGPFILSREEMNVIGGFYNTLMYLPSPPSLGLLSKPLLRLSSAPSEADYVTSKYKADNLVVIDDFLTEPALRHLVNFCREATVFFDVNDGYLGAYHFDGFMDEAFQKILQEMRTVFPEVLNLPLRHMWAYKYSDDGSRGIQVHADEAIVNVNLWLSPVDHDGMKGGGLEFWLQETPAEWTIYEMQSPEMLSQLVSKSPRTTVPYRQNRVVMFKSQLVHKSESFQFRTKGYENRRINLTFLFGNRKHSFKTKSPAKSKSKLGKTQEAGRSSAPEL